MLPLHTSQGIEQQKAPGFDGRAHLYTSEGFDGWWGRWGVLRIITYCCLRLRLIVIASG